MNIEHEKASEISSHNHLPSSASHEGKEDVNSDKQMADDGTMPSSSEPYLKGWRLRWTLLGLELGIFLASMEVSIVSTALVNITDELQDFKNGAWIINAYLVTFTGFLIIWVQTSHALGRRLFLVLAYLLFIAFSAACAGAQTMTQLIILRAFQGIGGAGVLNLSMAILSEAVRPEHFPQYSGVTSAVLIFAFGCGPLIGGGISSNTTWRWVFWLNIPAALVALIIDLVAIPRGFPNHSMLRTRSSKILPLKRLDLVGAILFLGASVMLISALQGPGVSWSWSSSITICLFLFAGISLILFTAWEWYVDTHWSSVVPILPWKFANRRCLGMLMSFLLVGMPTTSGIVQIPERFQIVHGLGPFDAAVRALPFIVTIPAVSLLCAIVVTKYKIKHAYALLIGTVFQVLGSVLFAYLSSSASIDPAEYGFQVLLAVGLGINNTILVTSIPHMTQRALIPSAMGAGMQFRYLGAVIGVGIVTAILNNSARSSLSSVLSPEELSRILQSTGAIQDLQPGLRQDVQSAFSQSFAESWKAMLGFICAQVIAAMMMV